MVQMLSEPRLSPCDSRWSHPGSAPGAHSPFTAFSDNWSVCVLGADELSLSYRRENTPSSYALPFALAWSATSRSSLVPISIFQFLELQRLALTSKPLESLHSPLSRQVPILPLPLTNSWGPPSHKCTCHFLWNNPFSPSSFRSRG